MARSRLARLNPDGTVDSTFNPSPNTTVAALLVQPDGKILVGGGFTTIAGTTRVRLARLNPNGSLDSGFTAGADGSVYSLAVQADGKILIGGLFAIVNETPRSAIARLNADGSLDAAFNLNVTGVNVGTQQQLAAIVVQPDGKILLGGNFSQVAGQPRASLARVNPDGSLDSTFNIGTGSTSDVQTIVLQPDGKILIGGSFSLFSGQIRRGIARLNQDGSLDNTSTSGPSGVVRVIVLQPDGKFFAGGNFNAVGTVPRSRLARFNSDGTLDSAFDPDVTGAIGLSTPGIYAMVAPAPGQLVFAGTFAAVSAQPRSGIARLGSPLPSITTQPTGLFATSGANVTLTVAATGDALRYQWRRDGADLPGATQSTLSLTNLQSNAGGAFNVAVANAYGASVSSSAVVSLATPPTVAFTFSTLAGSSTAIGRVDATGAAARFDHPTGLTIDAAGIIYTVDSVSNFIRKITPAGVVTTIASQVGLGIAVDGAGNLFVADARSRIIRISPTGVFTTFAGSATAGRADGTGADAQFDTPSAVALDRVGNIFVADTNNRTIRRITPAGVVTTLAGTAGQSGSTDGVGAEARFAFPRGLALDVAGNLIVADGVSVRKVTPVGVVTTLTTAANAIGVATDPAGNTYIAEVGAHTIRRLAPDGTNTLIAGATDVSGSDDGAGATARLNSPWGLVVDSTGNLYVADNGNNTIRKGTASVLPFAITLPPAPSHSAAGASVALSVGASGGNLAYQWKKDGAIIAGATNAAFTLANPSATADMGYYSAVVTSAGTSVETASAFLSVTNPAAPGRLINVATRGLVQPGGALTPGFVLRGTGTRQLVVRGVGPTLLRFGLGGSLADPRFELAPLGGATLLTNDDWATGGSTLAASSAAVGAFPLDPLSKDAAAFTTLTPTGNGTGYTVRVTGATATDSGIALAEIYDADPLTSPVQIVNVSTRGFVGTGANALVPGFVIGGSGPLQLLIRAVGPGLAPFGVTGLLADPQLTVTPLGKDTPVATNDNWGGTATLTAAFAAAGAFALPLDSKDAVVLLRLPPGAYTVTVSGVGGTTGTALVEIYEVP